MIIKRIGRSFLRRNTNKNANRSKVIESVVEPGRAEVIRNAKSELPTFLNSQRIFLIKYYFGLSNLSLKLPQMITREQVQDCAPYYIAGEFLRLYQKEFGDRKLVETIEKIKSSEKAQTIVQHIIYTSTNSSKYPDAKFIIEHMHTIRYFIFGKIETLCLGTMFTVSMAGDYFRGGLETDYPYSKEESRLLAEVLFYCIDMKGRLMGKFFADYLSILTQEYINI